MPAPKPLKLHFIMDRRELIYRDRYVYEIEFLPADPFFTGARNSHIIDIWTVATESQVQRIFENLIMGSRVFATAKTYENPKFKFEILINLKP